MKDEALSLVESEGERGAQQRQADDALVGTRHGVDEDLLAVADAERPGVGLEVPRAVRPEGERGIGLGDGVGPGTHFTAANGQIGGRGGRGQPGQIDLGVYREAVAGVAVQMVSS